MFDRDSDGALLVLGYPLFGGWLPYIGFITFYIDEDENDILRCFMIEWFCRSLIFTRSKEQDD